MNICVIGTGYVGLVTGTCFADFGIQVTCADIDEDKIARLNSGDVPIYEPGLDFLIGKNTKEGRLHFTTDLSLAIQQALVVFIAVGTPQGDDGRADLSAIAAVAETIGENLNGYKVIVTKSTVPAGTGLWISGIIKESLPCPVDYDVASNPEFLREGSAVEDFMRPNRVVIGAGSDQAIAILKDLYSPLFLIETPFVITSVETAEMIKYASNAFLATKISFINEVALLCERVGADVHQVAKGMGLDQRIGSKFLHPGPGYGGSCFPKDTEAFARLAREKDFELEIVNAVIRVNKKQREAMLEKVRQAVGGSVKGLRIAVGGLAFKPNTDDIREAPSIPILETLLSEGAEVHAYDPAAMENARERLREIHYASDLYEAAQDADLLIFLTEWNQFRKLDLELLKQRMKQPSIVDMRNIYEPSAMREKGFQYTAVGRL